MLGRAVDAGGLVLALSGPLGAGKTAFVQGLAAGLGVDPARVASPTFVIAVEHTAAGGRRLAHVDLYRVASAAELDAAGFPDLLGAGSVVAVEWADRLPGALPADRLELRIERGGGSEGTRVLHGRATGPVAEAVLAGWQRLLAAAGAPGLELEPAEPRRTSR
jgi:tRNA threonylcarbamoyladenosine biosynthesis protein TsaE